MLYPLKFWVCVRPSVSAPTILLPATPTVLGQSFSTYRRFYDNLKICMLFFQNPEIIFYHIFCIFNLDFFRALILQKCIGSMYLLPATPSTVLGQSFSNFTGAFRMVWRYAYCFFQNPEFIFYNIFCIFNLDFFRALIQQKCIGSMYLLPATPPTVLGQSFSNFTGAFRMVWRYAYCFFRILNLFFITFFCIFNLDFFPALILQKCIGSMYLLPATPPTVLGQSFSNFTGAFRMVWRYAYCFFQNPEFIFYYIFLHFKLRLFSSPNTTEMYREYVPSARNSFYSLRPILFKLYRRF